MAVNTALKFKENKEHLFRTKSTISFFPTYHGSRGTYALRISKTSSNEFFFKTGGTQGGGSSVEDFSELNLTLSFGNSVEWKHSNLKFQICKICFECVREPLMTQKPVLENRKGKGASQPRNISPPGPRSKYARKVDTTAVCFSFASLIATLRPRSGPRDPPFQPGELRGC